MTSNNLTWKDLLCHSTMVVDVHQTVIDKILVEEEVQNELIMADTWTGGPAPLHLAASFGRLEIMEKLYNAGADVNSYASGLGSWVTPLHAAALANQSEAAKLLLSFGADHTLRGFRDALKGTPKEFAEHEDHHELAKILDKPPKVSPKKRVRPRPKSSEDKEDKEDKAKDKAKDKANRKKSIDSLADKEWKMNGAARGRRGSTN